MKATHFFAFSVFLWLLSPLSVVGQEANPQNEPGKPRGAVILADVKGAVQVLVNATNQPLPAEEVAVNAVFYDGHTFVTGADGSAVLLFSNGTVTTLKADTRFAVNRFRQEKIEGAADQKVADLEAEPSPSETELELKVGDMVVDIKPLDKDSSFNIHSPVGVAGIRGTTVGMNVRPAAGGGFSSNITVPQGAVAFTPPAVPGQPAPAPVAINAGQTVAPAVNAAGAPTAPATPAPAPPAALAAINADVEQSAETTAEVTVTQVVTAVETVEQEAPADDGAAPDGGEATPGDEGGDEGGDGGDAGGADSGGADAPAAESVTSGDTSQSSSTESGSVESNDYVKLARKTGAENWDEIKTKDEKFVKSAAKLAAKGDASWSDLKDKSADKLADLATLVDAGKKFSEVKDYTDEQVTAAVQDASKEDGTGTGTGGDSQTGGDSGTTTPDPTTLQATLNTYSAALGNEVAYAKTDAGFNQAMEKAVALAETLLKDVTIDGSLAQGSVLNTKALTANSYNYELIRLVGKYGGIGSASSSSNLQIDDLLEFVGGYRSTDASGSGAFSAATLALLAGDGSSLDKKGNTDVLGTRRITTGEAHEDFPEFSIQNVNAVVGGKITFASGTSVDVSAHLPKAATSKDRKVLIIGSAKDMFVKGDLTFTNTNDVEDHALAIGSADDLYFRSEYSAANSADYLDPDPVTVTYTGSNLGIGSADKLRLVNVNLSAGGNLAVGSLDELHVTSTRSIPSLFSVGTGGKNSDPDNVYLYAHNLISVNGLQFGGRVDDVYMEAITIDLKNVTFPNYSDVMLRSRDGLPTFGSDARAVGHVNFIENVKYGETLLKTDHFGGAAGHVNSTFLLPNGNPAIKIRAFSTFNKTNVE